MLTAYASRTLSSRFVLGDAGGPSIDPAGYCGRSGGAYSHSPRRTSSRLLDAVQPGATRVDDSGCATATGSLLRALPVAHELRLEPISVAGPRGGLP